MCSIEGAVEREGEWRHGEATGRGSARYLDHSEYEGDFLRGRRHGRGRMVAHATGESFDGDWRDDQREGHGTLIAQGGKVTRGMWSRDRLLRTHRE